MTGKQEFQLIAPLVAGCGFFLMSLIITLFTGSLNRYLWKALLACSGLVAYALYLTFWQNEIKLYWISTPMIVAFALLLSLVIPIALFYWIWRVQKEAKLSGRVPQV